MNPYELLLLLKWINFYANDLLQYEVKHKTSFEHILIYKM